MQLNKYMNIEVKDDIQKYSELVQIRVYPLQIRMLPYPLLVAFFNSILSTSKV